MDNVNTNVLKYELDLIDAKILRLWYSSNPLKVYFSINSLQNKIDPLK